MSAAPSVSIFPVEIHEQVRGFINADAVQLGFLQLRLEALPDRDRQILCGRA